MENQTNLTFPLKNVKFMENFPGKVLIVAYIKNLE